MRHRLVTTPQLQWSQLAVWILHWDPVAEPNALLSDWARGLSAVAARIDPMVQWSPDHDLVTLTEDRTTKNIESVLLAAIAAYAEAM